ncbi:MAG: nuclear transport factor 2 family protein [Methylobacteriaceae bacterium]|nr:nuclear transport factor 2 family protein [Methylobacteriaceae bacterium]
MSKHLRSIVLLAVVGLTGLAGRAEAELKSAKACEDEYRTSKATIEGHGFTKKDFIAQCRMQTSANPAPAPAAAASPAPAPAAAAAMADGEAVKAAVGGFYAALAARDLEKMANVWAQEPYVVLINPRDKTPAVGWDAVKQDWQKTFDFWAELKPTTKDPEVRVDGTTASVVVPVTVEGKTKDGTALTYSVISTQIYQKRGDRWLLILNHASRVPE